MLIETTLRSFKSFVPLMYTTGLSQGRIPKWEIQKMKSESGRGRPIITPAPQAVLPDFPSSPVINSKTITDNLACKVYSE